MNSDFRKIVIYKVWSDQNLSFQIKIAQRWICEIEILVWNIDQYMIMLDFDHMTVTNQLMTFMNKILPNWRLWARAWCWSHDMFFKVHIFWEGHKILRNLPLTFYYMHCSQKLGEDFAKFLWPSQNVWTLQSYDFKSLNNYFTKKARTEPN